MVLILKLLQLIYYIKPKIKLKIKLMNEFMIALESFQDAHVLYTGEHISEDEIENKYDCRLNAFNLKKLKKQLIMLHSISLECTVGAFNPNDL